MNEGVNEATSSTRDADVFPFVRPTLKELVDVAHSGGEYDMIFCLWQRNHLRNITEQLTHYETEGRQAQLYILDYCMQAYRDGERFDVTCGLVKHYVAMFVEYMERNK